MSEQALHCPVLGNPGSVAAPGLRQAVRRGYACVRGPRTVPTPSCFDPGSGLRRLGLTFPEPVSAADIFSPFHYDHIIGLPFFSPLFDSTIQVTLWSGHLHGHMTHVRW